MQNEIGTNMKTCASPDLYFEVSPSQGISDAMNALFKKALAQARITQCTASARPASQALQSPYESNSRDDDLVSTIDLLQFARVVTVSCF